MTMVKFTQRPAFATLNNFLDSAVPSFPSLYREDYLTKGFKPSVPVNVKESGIGFILEVVAPGFSKEQFSIHIEKNILTVKGSPVQEQKPEGEKQLRKEYEAREFQKSFTLPETTDAEAISAQYVNGVLTLNLPGKVEVKEPTKQITIE